MNKTARTVVSLTRMPPAPALPKTELLPPPPKMTPMPSRPACSSTSMTSTTQTIT